MVDPKSITADLVQECISDAIRARVGPGKGTTVDALVDATGIDRRTIDAYRRGESTPGLSKLLRLSAVLGPAIINDVFGLAGLGGMERLDAPDQPDSFGINADLSAVVAMFGRHLADGRFDHMELAEQRRELGALCEALSQWIAAYDKSHGTVTPLHRQAGGRA